MIYLDKKRPSVEAGEAPGVPLIKNRAFMDKDEAPPITAEEWEKSNPPSSREDGAEVIPLRQGDFLGGFTYFEQ